jgi:hypothetical protein
MFDQGYSLEKAVTAAGLTRRALTRAAKESGLYEAWMKRNRTRPPRHDNILKRFLEYAAGQESVPKQLIYGQAADSERNRPSFRYLFGRRPNLSVIDLDRADDRLDTGGLSERDRSRGEVFRFSRITHPNSCKKGGIDFNKW